MTLIICIEEQILWSILSFSPVSNFCNFSPDILPHILLTWIYVCFQDKGESSAPTENKKLKLFGFNWLPLWSSGPSSQCYQIFWEAVGLEQGPLSLVRITEELLECKSSYSGSWKSKLTAMGIRCADHAIPSIAKVGTNFADKRRSHGRFSSLVD
jgi:hypothetical protein